ncbi:MAG: hypothetical protein PUJ07_03190 [Eubacteriales bacterium]|nr:hypothetical protein [Eubacteriales bacterium]
MKKFLVKVLAFTIAFSAFSAFVPVQNPNSVTNATESDKLTAAVYAMTGTLYYYDTPSGNIVLNDVKPFSVTTETSDSKENESDIAAVNAAAAMIYTEIPTAEGGMFFADGSHAAPDWINNYVDRQIWFIAAVAADGSVTIPYFKIIV